MFLSESVRWVDSAFFQGTLWAAAFAEIIAILASRSSLSVANHVLDVVLKETKTNLQLTFLSTIGILLIISGGLVRFLCYRVLKRLFTFEVSIRQNHELVTTGPYGVVRHPSYTGALGSYIGMICWYGSRGSWVRESGVMNILLGKVIVLALALLETMVVISLMLRMSEEDRLLKKLFGKKWDKWAQEVPYSIIPGIY